MKAIHLLILGFFSVTSVLGSALAVETGVNVYSYRQPFLVKPLFDAFTAETGIPVNLVYAKKGLLERLKNEGAKSPADLIFTVDISRLHDVQKAGLTQPVSSPVLEKNIPSQYRDSAGNWFGLTTRARIIVTSIDRMNDGEITTYEALADPKYKGRVCTRSGKHAYMVALVSAMIAHHGEARAEQWLRGLRANLARKPQGNDRAQVKAIKEGICDIAVINHYYMGKMLADEKQMAWAKAVRVVFPNQTSSGTHVNLSGVALTRSAPHRTQAIALMEFLSSPKAQRMYAEQNTEYPVVTGVEWSDLLKRFGKFKTDDLSLDTVAGKRKEASRLVDRVNYDG